MVEGISYQQAFELLSNQLTAKGVSVEIESFPEFVKNTWALSYQSPEYFQAWHVQLVCQDAENALKMNKGYVAVLPRLHLKSTVLGYAYSVWTGLRLTMQYNIDATVLYLSYSDSMSQYHIAEIKKHIRRNPKLSVALFDRVRESDFSCRYLIGERQFDILHGGLFSFKRGTHVNGALICDDLLRDPSSALNMSQLLKVEDHFLTETIFIPLRNTPIVVLGTPMMPGDLLAKLQYDERFISRVLPALNPAPDREILMPELYDKQWLLRHQQSNPRSFASEFMLMPYSSTLSYFTDEAIRKRENSTLRQLDPNQKHSIDCNYIVAGFDVGKKRHPSHLTIFKDTGEKLQQICQIFLDNWDYTEQIKLLNKATENFGIHKGYYDSTRGELDERGIDDHWRPISFSQKQKHKMAQVMEQYVNEGKIEFIPDERQRMQITSVDGNLDAPETPLGHGDAFFSNALAIMAHYDTFARGTMTIGNMADFLAPEIGIEKSSDFMTEDKTMLFHSGCPQCGNTTAWIEDNKLCLMCGYRGEKYGKLV